MTTPATADLPAAPDLAADIARWLAEDVGAGDRTTDAIVPADATCRATLLLKEPGVVCGLGPGAPGVRGARPRACAREPLAADGDRVSPGIVGTLDGPARAVLTGERLALNLLGRLSGIATLTRRYVDAVAGTARRHPRHPQDDARACAPPRSGPSAAVAAPTTGWASTTPCSSRTTTCCSRPTSRPPIAAARGTGLPVEVECDTLDQVGAGPRRGRRPDPARQHVPRRS